MAKRQPAAWQGVQCPEYRQLGDIVALLEALDRGVDIAPGDSVPDGRDREATLVAERLMSRRAACRRLLVVTAANILAICQQSIGAGDDLVFWQCRVLEGENALDTQAREDYASPN